MIWIKNKKILFFLTVGITFSSISLSQDTLYIGLSDIIRILDQNSMSSQEPFNQETRSTRLPTLSPTEITYRYGQLYSPDYGWKVSVNQEIGPFGQTNRQKKIDQSVYNISFLSGRQENKKLRMHCKSLYLRWIYLYNKSEIAKIRYQYVQKRMDIASVQEDLGETEPYQKMLEQTLISSIETSYYESLYDIEIATNEIQTLLNTDNQLLPVSKRLEMYMIQKSQDISTYKTSNSSEILAEKQHLYEAQAELGRIGFFPSLEVGFYVQDFAPYSTMAGIQAGIKIPISYKAVKEKIQKNLISAQRAKIEFDQSEFRSKMEIESLIIQLDKLFLRIRHYQDYALPTADMVINTATIKYTLEDISFDEYFQLIDNALKTQSEYLDCINEYNQTALKLEFYTE